MRIQEASKVSGLGPDTIRYYEKEGLLPPIDRDESGHRKFSAANVEWLGILYWLRKTGMPMKDMSLYAEMVHAGDQTIPERIVILTKHQKRLHARREELDRCEDLLSLKLSTYGSLMEEGRHNDDGTRKALER